MTDVESILKDPDRLAALAETALLDTPPEEAFDRFTRIASRVLQTPVSLVSLVADDRQFFKSQVGLTEPLRSRRETPLSYSFCRYVVATRRPLIVNDARLHPELHDNPAVHEYGVVAYVGVPLITPDGHALGTLCALDYVPRDWTDADAAPVHDLATFLMNEIELRHFCRLFHKNYAALRQLELQRTEMVDMLVHDLRNPLTSLLAGLDLAALAPELDAQLRDDLAMARDGARILKQMVDDILDVSRADAGHLRLHLRDTSPEALLDDARSQVANLALTNNIRLAVEKQQPLPLVRVDAAKLRRVLVNLAANALQHTDRDGEVTMTAAPEINGRAIVFRIHDTGRGIPRDALPYIFEKFRAAGGDASRYSSTGLGLPFCRMVVEAHGGEIGVDSSPASGTTFTVRIPVEPSLRQAA